MGVAGGPDLIQDGLVLSLDASDRNSYVSGSTTWFDLSGNNLSGSLLNGPTFNTGSLGSIVFDGVNDYVDGGTFTGLGAANRTIDIWFRVNAFSSGSVNRVLSLVTDNTIVDTPAYTLGYGTTPTTLNVGFGGTPYNGYFFISSFALSTWINITTTITGNTNTTYKNSILEGTATNTGAVGANPRLYIARYNNYYGQYGNINIGSVKIYNRALSASEILQNYNAQKSKFGL
jgi:hypothetical protein